jgi:hypothetical protein
MKNEDGRVWSYKKVNVQKDRDNYIVQVWEKYVPSNKVRKEIKKTPPPLGYENGIVISSYMDLKEIDCKKQRIRTLSSITYDDDGKESSSETYDESKWEYIVPDSNDETLSKEVCK